MLSLSNLTSIDNEMSNYRKLLMIVKKFLFRFTLPNYTVNMWSKKLFRLFNIPLTKKGPSGPLKQILTNQLSTSNISVSKRML